MRIDQRNAGASVTNIAGYVYCLDRLILGASQASKFTAQQNAGSVTPPAGFNNYLGATSSSAYTVGTSEQFWIIQRIEGFNTADLAWGTANAQTVTLSFWVRSSLTGTFGGSIYNSGANYSYPFSYSIASANTWTKISLAITGPTAGTWVGSTNGTGIQINFSLGAGATSSGTAGAWSSNFYASATGATSVVGTSGATFYITGLQMELGTVATPFEHRSYGTELALCQRYYFKSFPNAQYSNFGSCYADSTVQAKGFIPFSVPMRIAPTALEQNGVAVDYSVRIGGTVTVCSAVPIASASTTIVLGGANFRVASGLTIGQSGEMRTSTSTTAGYLAWSAEL
jgi:hypothetical protein